MYVLFFFSVVLFAHGLVTVLMDGCVWTGECVWDCLWVNEWGVKTAGEGGFGRVLTARESSRRCGCGCGCQCGLVDFGSRLRYVPAGAMAYCVAR